MNPISEAAASPAVAEGTADTVPIGLRARITAALLNTSGDPGHERLRRVFLTAMASLVSRVGTVAVLLITVPMALHHLGLERFGVWMILSSLAAITAFADFGIGNGLLNLVAAASGTDDDQAIRQAASSALVMLCGIAILIAGASVAGYFFVDWASLFRVQSAVARAEAAPSVMMFGLCLAVGLPLTLGTKVQFGLQQGYAANLWIGVGGAISMVAVVIAILLGAGTPTMVLALFGSQQLAMLFNSLHFFGFSRPELRPHLSLARRSQARALFSLGTTFFLLQLVGIIAFRVDALIIARFFGPEQAGVYAVYERMFSFITMIVGVVVMPLWPAYGEAMGRGDYRWIASIFKRSLLISIAVTAFACLPLVLFHDRLVHLWLGKVLLVPTLLVVGLGLWKILEAIGLSVGALLNGAGAIRVQLLLAVIMCTVGFLLKVTLADRFGLAWMAWSNIIAYVCIILLPLAFIIPPLLRRTGSVS